MRWDARNRTSLCRPAHQFSPLQQPSRRRPIEVAYAFSQPDLMLRFPALGRYAVLMVPVFPGCQSQLVALHSCHRWRQGVRLPTQPFSYTRCEEMLGAALTADRPIAARCLRCTVPPSSVMTAEEVRAAVRLTHPQNTLQSPRLMALPKQVTKESFSILSAPEPWALPACLA